MRTFVFTLTAFTVLAAATSAVASEALLPGESIVDRKRPELDPQGMPVGAFRLYPSVGLGVQSDRNIFATEQGEIADTILRVTPKLLLESDWSRHELRATADATLARYSDNSAEDFNDVDVGASATLEVSRATAIQLRGNYAAIHEDRYSPDDVAGFEPTPLDRVEAGVSVAHRAGRVTLRLGAQLRDEDFGNVPGALGIVNNDDRDRRQTGIQADVSVELRAQAELYATASADQRAYDRQVDDNGLDRTSKGNGVAVGVRAALSGASYVDLFVGYLQRDYDDIALSSIDAPWFGGSLIWNPSGLTTVTLDVRRSVEETTSGSSSGYRATRFGLAADHELRRNLLLHGDIYLQTNQYEGSSRDDDVSGIALGARYLMNRYLNLDLSYQRRARDSSASPAIDYATDIVTLTVRVTR